MEAGGGGAPWPVAFLIPDPIGSRTTTAELREAGNDGEVAEVGIHPGGS